MPTCWSKSCARQTREIIRRALGNRLVVENFSRAGIGYLRAEDRDAIPQAADFLLTDVFRLAMMIGSTCWTNSWAGSGCSFWLHCTAAP